MIEKQNAMDREWDILILLDGCRYDYFKEYNTIKGNLKKVVSPSTGTKDWFERIINSKCDDIIYLTPIVKFDTWYPNHGLFKEVKLWGDKKSFKYSALNPLDISRIAGEYIKKYPNKRIIVHFLVPHPPFLTMAPEHKEKIKKESLKTDENIKKSKLKRKFLFIIWMLKQRFPTIIFWHLERLLGLHGGMLVLYKTGGFKLIRELYRNNLILALSAINKIYTRGKMIITADHGQRLGEYGMFGHGGWRSKSVIEVPWFEVEKCK